MPKKRKLRENTDRREVWGANKQTAKRLAAERELKNRLFEAEAHLRNANVSISQLVNERDDFRRLLDRACDPKRIAQLRTVCQMPVQGAVKYAIVTPLADLTVWLRELEEGVVANVKQALSAANGLSVPARPLGTIPNAEPLMPRPSGITKLKNDEDDPDSIDDLFAKAVDVHIERMDENHYWIGIIQVGGLTTHIDITWTKKTGLRAWVRK